jgi:hypothetical protein
VVNHPKSDGVKRGGSTIVGFAAVRLGAAERLARLSVFFGRRGARVIAAWQLEEVEAAASVEAVALTTWLTLLGWQVQIERDGELHVGVARHITADGQRLVVGSCAVTKAAGVWELFEAVMGRLGAIGERETLRDRIGVAA